MNLRTIAFLVVATILAAFAGCQVEEEKVEEGGLPTSFRGLWKGQCLSETTVLSYRPSLQVHGDKIHVWKDHFAEAACSGRIVKTDSLTLDVEDFEHNLEELKLRASRKIDESSLPKGALKAIEVSIFAVENHMTWKPKNDEIFRKSQTIRKRKFNKTGQQNRTWYLRRVGAEAI